jgi:hypothetical protein
MSFFFNFETRPNLLMRETIHLDARHGILGSGMDFAPGQLYSRPWILALRQLDAGTVIKTDKYRRGKNHYE